MTRFYRALLRLYPGSFRDDYAPELTRAYVEQTRGRGRVSAALAALTDVVPNALAAHWALVVQDVRYTLRSLNAARGFAVATILVTALGVGANTATFSIADYVLLRPLAFPRSDELVRVCEGPRAGGGWGCMNQLSPATYRDVVAMNRSFSSIGVFTGRDMNLVGTGEPVRVRAVAVTPEVFPVLGVHPLLGRVFDPRRSAEDERTAVITYGLWQAQLGGDPAILGRSVRLDGTPFTIIGVMPPPFIWPAEQVQIYTPLTLTESDYEDRNNSYLDGIARLAPGVTFEQARADLGAISDRLTRSVGAQYDGGEIGFSFWRQRDEMSPRYRTILVALCGASLALLLLTCANLANILLARAASRGRELAVRAALGAGRERLMRQLLTESLVLAVLGGVAGAALAWVTVPLLTRLVPDTLPIASRPTLDLRAFAIAAVLSAITGLGFGLMPALRATSRRGLEALRDGARAATSTRGLRTVLVAVEVALSVVLLVAAGLLIRAVWRVQHVDPGFTARDVLTMTTALPTPKYDDATPRVRFYRRVLSDVRALPGVQSAAYTSGLPMVMTGGITRIAIKGVELPRDARSASIRVISSQLFSTLQIPVRRGRDLHDDDDGDHALVAVVSESLAKQFWPGGDAIGRQFQTRDETRTVVGVVSDIRVRGLERSSEPQLYVPMAQADAFLGIYTPKVLVVRMASDPRSLVAPVREIVRAADPEQPISNVRMLSTVIGDQTATRRSQLDILTALAALALVLAAVGIHGLLTFTLTQRTREIGVRLALGAAPSTVARMMVTDGVRMALYGAVPGVAIAYVAARAMRSLLFGIPAADPATFVVVAALCLTTVVVASLRPAWRAARVSPMSALRAD